MVTFEQLLVAEADATMESLMDRETPAVAAGVDQEAAAWRAVRHGESAPAVVDQHAYCVGVIPPHRVIAVLRSEHEEDLSRAGEFLKSTSVARATSEEAVQRRFRHPLPRLLLGLGGASLAADLVGSFETHLRVHLMLVFFIPSIVLSGGRRGDADGGGGRAWPSLGVPMRELLGGVLIGMALAAVRCHLSGGVGVTRLWRWP